MNFAIIFALAASVLSIVYGLILIRSILKLSTGSERMQEIAKAIQLGAKAYLKRQYNTIALIGIVVFALLWIFLDMRIS